MGWVRGSSGLSADANSYPGLCSLLSEIDNRIFHPKKSDAISTIAEVYLRTYVNTVLTT